MKGARQRHRWRDYSTAAGRRPVKEFIDELSDVDSAAVAAAMKDVAREGLAAARHVRGEIYEVRAPGDRSTESTRRTPPRLVDLAGVVWRIGVGGHLEFDISNKI
jgi:hypothetical protein